MANSWHGLNQQLKKVKSALNTLTPPVPDDRFEMARGDLNHRIDKTISIVQEKAKEE